jgi:DNA-binding transcriptional LysR family regulator
MELRHLRYFLAVAETLNFTEAAKRLRISQPPLSQQIADLEKELQVKLFARHSRRVELTVAGRSFLRHAESMLTQSTSAIDEVRAIGAGRAGMIRVAATSSVLHSGLASRISSFRQKHPKIEFVILELSPQEQIERILDYRVDVCFIRFTPNEPQLVVHRAWSERAKLAVPLSHRLAPRKSVKLIDLASEDFVFYRVRESTFASHLYASCVAAGFSPRIVQEVVEAFTLSSLVSAGLGIGFVPEFMAKLPDVRYLTIQGTAPTADVYALRHEKSHPVATQFFEWACR